jgi:hypothetical protein
VGKFSIPDWRGESLIVNPFKAGPRYRILAPHFETQAKFKVEERKFRGFRIFWRPISARRIRPEWGFRPTPDGWAGAFGSLLNYETHTAQLCQVVLLLLLLRECEAAELAAARFWSLVERVAGRFLTGGTLASLPWLHVDRKTGVITLPSLPWLDFAALEPRDRCLYVLREYWVDAKQRSDAACERWTRLAVLLNNEKTEIILRAVEDERWRFEQLAIECGYWADMSGFVPGPPYSEINGGRMEHAAAALAHFDGILAARVNATATIRTEWLNREMSKHEIKITNINQVPGPGGKGRGPDRKTLVRWSAGETNRQTETIREKLAEFFGCDLTEVPR